VRTADEGSQEVHPLRSLAGENGVAPQAAQGTDAFS
jgi:hypothetical protein